MNLVEQYEQAADSGLITRDITQLQALNKLQRVLTEVEQPQSLWQRVFTKKKPIQGLYFYGSVGVGKTYVMDLFFDTVQSVPKMRRHFHAFMKEVDAELRRLQGARDPLAKVADMIAAKAKLLCFDEFFVHDIADAMILGRLFKALFNRGITLVTTSNIEPDKLYYNGLHRKRFLPTIELIKKHCEIYSFDSSQDYRLTKLMKSGVYFTPLNEKSHSRMQAFFQLCSHGNGEDKQSLWIENRPIETVRLAEKVVWFEFNVLCNIPRSQLDYVAIAERFDTILLSGVKAMSQQDMVLITNFIHLIDVLYDEGVHLILSAQTDIDSLYSGQSKAFEFERTKSRLTEMQSKQYLASLPHHVKHAATTGRLAED